MRKIEEKMIEAVLNEENFSLDNTRVEITPKTIDIYLFNNCIAVQDRCTGTWTIRLGGYNSVTTRSRLNALSTIFNDSFMGVGNRQHKPYLFYDGEQTLMNENDFYFVGK